LLDPCNKLLVIDDQADLCEFISEAAKAMGFEALAVTEPDAFRRALEDFQPTVVVLDLQMPGADGIELLRYLGERGIKAHVLVASGMVELTGEQLVLTHPDRFSAEAIAGATARLATLTGAAPAA